MDLYRTLRSLRDRERGIKPDAAWVRSTRATLLMQVRNTIPTAAVAAKYRIPMFSSLYQYVIEKLRGPVLATISIAGIALGGSIASVSAAENSLPGDALYTVKLVTEQAQLAFAQSAPDKIKLKSGFTKRRVEELHTIVTTDVTHKDVRASLAADVLKRDLDTLKQQLNDVQSQADVKDAADAVKEADKNAVEVVKALAETRDALSPDVKEKVAAAQLQAADVGIKALEVMVAVNQQDGGDAAVSSSDLDASLALHTEVAANSVATAKAAAAGIPVDASSTVVMINASGTSTTPVLLVTDAEQSLVAAQALSGDDQKIGETIGLLKDATFKSLAVQKQVDQATLTLSNASSTPATVDTSTSGTTPVVATTSSTPAIPALPTSTSSTTSSTSKTVSPPK
jgi:hypothetical protein